MMDIYSKITEIRNNGDKAVLITVTSKEGNSPTDVGKKLLVTSDHNFIGTIGGGSIEHFAINKAKEILKSKTSISENYVLNDKEIKVADDEIKLEMACGGKATLFYEYIGPLERVYIFGAGHCGKEISALLKNMDFFTVLIDDRAELLEIAKNDANKLINSSFADFFEKYNLTSDDYIVVSTPSHKYDYLVLDNIFEKEINPAYFGMLCSRKKIHDYLTDLKQKYPNANLKNFYSPIGLDIGGDSPKEVAISVVGEILAKHYGKESINSHMRNKVNKEDKYF